MKNEQVLNQAQVEQIICAAKEEIITPRDLAADILPLIVENIMGEFALVDDSITYAAHNGQKFKISISEIG